MPSPLVATTLGLLAYTPAPLQQFSAQRAAVTTLAAVVASPRVPHPPLAMADAMKPFRSDENFDYFRQIRAVEVTLTKPMGAVLEEAKPSGVKVEELQDGGSAAETGLLKKGDRLARIMGTDVTSASFDEAMELLIDAPEEVELRVLRTVITRKPRVFPKLTVDGKELTVDRGVVMRTAIQSNGMEIHKGMKAKMSSCGGGGQCASCWVEVLEGIENLSDETAAEERMRKSRPENWRMACQYAPCRQQPANAAAAPLLRLSLSCSHMRARTSLLLPGRLSTVP